MNCCDDYGKCTQGEGCAARATPSDIAQLEPIIAPNQSLWRGLGDPLGMTTQTQERRERLREEYDSRLDDPREEEREKPQYED